MYIYIYTSGGLNLAVEANSGCNIFLHTKYYSAEIFRHCSMVLFPSFLCTDCTQQAGSRFQAL
jgi:hypothetical protein